jgi:outer membrane protein OmpA-like peptidoglycan-associated protein
MESASPRGDGFGEWWAAIAVIATATMAIVSLSGSAEPAARFPASDPTPEILATLAPAERSLAAVETAFESLCREPVLLALELAPDCETGVITLPDEFFEGFGSSRLGPEARQDVGAAMTTYLSRLRRLPAIWDSLEGIEIRGHTDPRALRDAYSTNMVGSQQRALGVLLFLIGPGGLAESDRDDLERLAIVSGAAFSRPPTSCPEQTRECYEQWRRVEIRPILSESLRRGDWSRTVEEIRVATEHAQQSTETKRQ